MLLVSIASFLWMLLLGSYFSFGKYWIYLGFTISFLMNVTGFFWGVQSFRKSEPSFIKKYIGLGGNACILVGQTLIIFEFLIYVFYTIMD